MPSLCPYCRSRSYKNLYKTDDIFGNEYDIVKCLKCPAYFLSPNPDDALLTKAYDQSYYGGTEEQEKFEGLVEKGLQYFRKKRAEKAADLMQHQGRVLDIGCGNGQFLENVSRFGDIEIHGTEMPGGSAQRALRVKNLHLRIGELSRGDYPDNYFDLIALFHVFEHLKRPRSYLKIIGDILKPGRYLMISFPNIDSWQARFFKGKWLHLDPPRHLFFFSPTDFKNLMHMQNYRLVEEKYFSIEQNPYGAIQSWFNLFHRKRELLFESLKGNTDYTRDTPSTVLKLEKLLFMGLMPVFILSDLWASVFDKGATIELIFQKPNR